MPLKYWVPPAAWMAVILTLSSDVGSAEHTANWLLPLFRALAPSATPGQLTAVHSLVRKAGHLTEYAVLALLWYRAFARGRRASPRIAPAFAISLGWAMLDELRQSLVPTRTASAMDVALDGLGALIALTFVGLGWRTAIDRATTTLLWFALIGGVTFLVLNAITAVPSGALWLTTPLAALLLLARHLHRRRSIAQPKRPNHTNPQTPGSARS